MNSQTRPRPKKKTRPGHAQSKPVSSVQHTVTVPPKTFTHKVIRAAALKYVPDEDPYLRMVGWKWKVQRDGPPIATLGFFVFASSGELPKSYVLPPIPSEVNLADLLGGDPEGGLYDVVKVRTQIIFTGRLKPLGGRKKKKKKKRIKVTNIHLVKEVDGNPPPEPPPPPNRPVLRPGSKIRGAVNGTVAALLELDNTAGAFLVSAQHVLAVDNQPLPRNIFGQDHPDPIGEVTLLGNPHFDADTLYDYAVAKITSSHFQLSTAIDGLREPDAAAEVLVTGDYVVKSGMRTLVTRGRIDFPDVVEQGSGDWDIFGFTIRDEDYNVAPFAMDGDSGSLVCLSDDLYQSLHPAGILLSRSTDGKEIYFAISLSDFLREADAEVMDPTTAANT